MTKTTAATPLTPHTCAMKVANATTRASDKHVRLNKHTTNATSPKLEHLQPLPIQMQTREYDRKREKHKQVYTESQRDRERGFVCGRVKKNDDNKNRIKSSNKHCFLKLNHTFEKSERETNRLRERKRERMNTY